MSEAPQSIGKYRGSFSEQGIIPPEWHPVGPQETQIPPHIMLRAIKVGFRRALFATAEARALADAEDRLKRAARCRSPEARAIVMGVPAEPMSFREALQSILKHARAANLEPRLYHLIWLMLKTAKPDHVIPTNETSPSIAGDSA